MIKKIKRKNGFTLIELLVVVAIIGILAVVAIPSLIGSIEKAKVAEFVSEVNAIKTSVAVEYANNSDFGRNKFFIHGKLTNGKEENAKDTLDIDGFENVLNAVEISLDSDTTGREDATLQFYFQGKNKVPSDRIIDRIKKAIPNVEYVEEEVAPTQGGTMATLSIEYNVELH